MQPIIFCSYNGDLLPYKATEGAIGRDLKLAESCIVKQGEVVLAPTGVKVASPLGWGIKIYARSSLPIKFGIIVANSVGLIDSDYRGEIKVELTSLSGDVKLEKGMRIAQLEICPYFQEGKMFGGDVPKIEMIVNGDVYDNFVERFSTERGDGGFGSTTN